MSEQDFVPGLRFAITWLHERAKSMNDPKATQILNSAAFSLGVAKARGGFSLESSGYRILAPGQLDPETVERCADILDRGVYGSKHDATLAWELAGLIRRSLGEHP